MEELMNNEAVANVVENVTEQVSENAVEAVKPVEVVDVVRNTSGKEVICAAIGAGAMAAVYGIYRGVRYAWNKWGEPKYEEAKEKRAAKKQEKLQASGKKSDNEERYVVEDDESYEETEE